MLTYKTQSLNNILNDGKFGSDKKGLAFSGQCLGSGRSSTMFVRASDSKNKSEEKATLSKVNTSYQKTTQRLIKRWTCYLCGRLGHIRPFYFL